MNAPLVILGSIVVPTFCGYRNFDLELGVHYSIEDVDFDGNRFVAATLVPVADIALIDLPKRRSYRVTSSRAFRVIG